MEKYTGEQLWNQALRKVCLDETPKAQSPKGKSDKLDYSGFKTPGLQRPRQSKEEVTQGLSTSGCGHSGQEGYPAIQGAVLETDKVKPDNQADGKPSIPNITYGDSISTTFWK